MKKRRLIPWILCLAMLLLLCIVPVQAEGEEPEPEAANITKAFLFEPSNKAIIALYAYDGNLQTHAILHPDDVLRVRSRTGDIPMNILYFRLGMGREGWEDAPFPLTIRDAIFELRQYDRAGQLLLSGTDDKAVWLNGSQGKLYSGFTTIDASEMKGDTILAGRCQPQADGRSEGNAGDFGDRAGL